MSRKTTLVSKEILASETVSKGGSNEMDKPKQI